MAVLAALAVGGGIVATALPAAAADPGPDTTTEPAENGVDADVTTPEPPADPADPGPADVESPAVGEEPEVPADEPPATDPPVTEPPVTDDVVVPEDPAVLPDPAAPAEEAAIVPFAVPGFPEPTTHTQEAFDPVTSSFTSRWTRADARQILAMSDPTAPDGVSSMPAEYTMPEIPQDFPILTDQGGTQVWVWDTWTLTDEAANQISFKGWEVAFSLVADPNAGYTFDDRHVHARIGYFYRKADIPAAQRPANGGWIYGGLAFPDGASRAIFDDPDLTEQTEWSGSTRLMDGNKLRVFYTAVGFVRGTDGGGNPYDIKPADPRIVQSEGRLFADENGVWLTGLRDQHELLVPDGTWYQTKEQNNFTNFRDPFTFRDPAHPGQDFMVFEGNGGGDRATAQCSEEDLGYLPVDPEAEVLADVNASGAPFQRGNVGLAIAENKAMTQWRFLPPILSANCVNDQTERPQIYQKDGKYYIFTISHRHTFSAGVTGPDGVYGFVGDGIRSDFQPLNRGSGLALGNPTNLNRPVGTPASPDPTQTQHAFQAYSHYVMPNELVESFIDAIGGPGDVRRGGTLAPTVRLNLQGVDATVDLTYGDAGLGGFGDIPSNTAHPVPGTPDPRPIS